MVRPEDVRSEIAELGVTRQTLAKLANLNPGGLSAFLTGHRELSPGAQREILFVLHFFQQLRCETALPIDFNDLVRLRPTWEAYNARRDAGEVRITKTQLAAAGEAAA